MIAELVAYIALTLLGVGFAAPLAVVVGVFDLLPLVGATIAAIIVAVVTLFYSFPATRSSGPSSSSSTSKSKTTFSRRSFTGARLPSRGCSCSSRC
jgi:hypothetical protein